MNKIIYITLIIMLLVSCKKAETSEPPHETPITHTETAVPAAASEVPVKKEEDPPTAAPVTTDPIEDYINKCLNEMSLAEKIGQMFICAYNGGSQGATEISESMKKTIKDYHLGGVILFQDNIIGEDQTRTLITDLQNESEIPLFMAVDEEGGTVSRLSALGYARLSSASKTGLSGDSSQAYERGVTIAQNLKKLGFNLDFAPVADINTNKQNTVIGSRAFSTDPDIAGEMVSEFVKGMQGEGIIAALKHFPGHGDTTADTHRGIASVTHDMDRLAEKELIPFQMGIDSGVGFVMMGHISAPNITGNDEPSIFSEKIVTEILRDQMGFDGIIITDALNMGAIVNYYESGETAVKSVLSGVDMLLMPRDVEQAYTGVLNAVQNGEISESKINESVSRILRMKALYGILSYAF